MGKARVGGQLWPAWDLGLLLGLGSQETALVLLRVPWRRTTVAVALRTGPCLAVQRVPQTWPLPARVFGDRPGAVSSAFEAAALGRPHEAVMGYLVEPCSLWTDAELAASAAAGQQEKPPAQGRL